MVAMATITHKHGHTEWPPVTSLLITELVNKLAPILGQSAPEVSRSIVDWMWISIFIGRNFYLVK